MQEQLFKIYSQALQEFGDQQSLENMELHLKKKAEQLQRLQMCFECEIKQIQGYEKKENVYKRLFIKALLVFDYLKKQLRLVQNDWNKMLTWKNEMAQALLTLVSNNQKSHKQNKQNMVKSRVEVNETEFHRIQSRYRQQIQRQSQMINQLQSVLKNKSKPKNYNNTLDLSNKKSSINIKSQNIEVWANRKVSPRKQINDIPHLHDKSKSPLKQRTLNKEEVVEKIRKYAQCKTMRENFNASQRKICFQDAVKAIQVPPLPQLHMAFNFQIPVASGFDILVIDNKQVYRGMWKRGVFQGKGKYFSDQWVYDGEFKNGYIDGFGTLSFRKWKFVGKFEKGLAHGEGTLYYKERTISGFWKNHLLVKQY